MGHAPPCRRWVTQVIIDHLPFGYILTASCRRLLILGYLSGLQIWDCTNLDSITEMLNSSGPEWGSIWNAQVLPGPHPVTGDQFLSSRPLLGLMCGSIPFLRLALSQSLSSSKRLHQEPDFLVYSLLTHKIIKKYSIPGISSFSANSNVIIIVSVFPYVRCRLIIPVLEHVKSNFTPCPFILYICIPIYHLIGSFNLYASIIINDNHESRYHCITIKRYRH